MLKRHVPCGRFPERGPKGRLRAGLFVALLVLWAIPAQAATVALLAPARRAPEVTEALFRLQGELLAVGLEVELLARPPSLGSDPIETNAWFESMAAERGIVAVIDVLGDPLPVGVDIWIFRQSSHRFRVSRVALEPDTENAPETLAIRAIEVLRANFIVIDLAGKDATQPSSPEPARTPASEPLETVGPFGVAAGASLLFGLDGVGPAILPRVRFLRTLDWEFSLEATLCGFGTRPSVVTDAGGVRVAQHYGLLGVRYTARPDAVLAPFVTLAAGAMRTALHGWAEAPNRGHRVAEWAFLVEGSLGSRLKLSQRYFLSLEAAAQLATPYVAIHFVDTQVATSGRPNLLASLTVGAWL